MKYNDFKFNEFEADLRWSELPKQYVIYMQSIVHWWPNALGWDRITDLIQQKQGKDISIDLPDNKTIKIQFKARRSDYGDICIEYRHDYFSGYEKPGWIELPSSADYLLYCVPENVYRIDYKQLHNKWLLYKNSWISNYDLTPARNDGYNTRNVGIKFDVLEKAGIEIEKLHIPIILPTKSEKEAHPTIHWPDYPADNHPLWPIELYQSWIDKNLGSKEQSARYKVSVAWYQDGK